MSADLGNKVAEYINPITGDEQVQPNGVDLRVGKVFELLGKMRLEKDGKELPDRKDVSFGNTDKAVLSEGVYVVRYAEKIHIPDDRVGLVWPRSTLMRGGNMLNTALWDPGYEGIGEGRLKIDTEMILEKGARIGQITFLDADYSEGETRYEGQYQNENLEDK